MIMIRYFHENISSLDFTMFTIWSSQCACNMLKKILYDPGPKEKCQSSNVSFWIPASEIKISRKVLESKK